MWRMLLSLNPRPWRTSPAGERRRRNSGATSKSAASMGPGFFCRGEAPLREPRWGLRFQARLRAGVVFDSWRHRVRPPFTYQGTRFFRDFKVLALLRATPGGGRITSPLASGGGAPVPLGGWDAGSLAARLFDHVAFGGGVGLGCGAVGVGWRLSRGRPFGESAQGAQQTQVLFLAQRGGVVEVG